MSATAARAEAPSLDRQLREETARLEQLGRSSEGGGTLATRLRGIIDRVHEGSVRRAAQLVGIPQPTLDRIVRGASLNPRSDALQRLAQAYDVSIDWLLTGAGKGPDDRTLLREPLLKWLKIVRLLAVDESVKAALLDLPRATLNAVSTFGLLCLDPDQPQQAYKWVSAFDDEHSAWVRFFELWLTDDGVDVVSQLVTKNAAYFDERFVNSPHKRLRLEA